MFIQGVLSGAIFVDKHHVQRYCRRLTDWIKAKFFLSSRGLGLDFDRPVERKKGFSFLKSERKLLIGLEVNMVVFKLKFKGGIHGKA